MQDLTPVGLTEDGSRLVLVADRGERFSVVVDSTLRAALRGEHAHLGHLEIRMDSALRPRDIQARIRSGQSAEAVAAAAQTTLDRIMGFAGPVLAERAHIASQAQQASVRRRAGEGGPGVLHEAVAARLQERSVDPEAVAWDAWRRDDGRWTLAADYLSGGSTRHAEFTYDAPGRYVVADDEESRWLLGEPSSSHGPQPRAATGPTTEPTTGRRRSSSGPDAEDELPLGEDAIAMVSDGPGPAAVRGPAPTLAAVPTVGTSEDVGPTPDADWMGTQASERPRERPLGGSAVTDLPGRPGRSVEDTGDATTAADGDLEQPTVTEARPEAAGSADSPAASNSSNDPNDPEDSEDPEDPKDTATKPAPSPRRPRRSRSRASVPSWDEIMFGSGRAE